jgi:succinate dehydrogenase / fumarate reductase membrane anchor subunit
MGCSAGQEVNMATTTVTETPGQVVRPRSNYETIAWKWMRYSAILLIPLVWIHVLLQDVIVGVHRIDLSYVALRWANVGWRIYDVALLGFAFAHGVNGLRQILSEYVHPPRLRVFMNWALLIFWLVITAIGAIAIIGGVRSTTALVGR